MGDELDDHEVRAGTSGTGAEPRRRAVPLPGRAGQLHVGWFTRQGLVLHLTVLVVFTGCVIAAWWQTDRALSGNALSWAYAFEWPCFAIYAVVLWWKLLHEPPEVRAETLPGRAGAGDVTPNPERLLSLAATAEIERARRQGDWHP